MPLNPPSPGTSQTHESPLLSATALTIAGLLLLDLAVALAIAFRWPFVHDIPLMHYVVFLMDHGWAPYRDIVEMNMPGTYIADWLTVHLLGPAAHGVWLLDLICCLLLLASSASIAGPRRRASGLAAGALACLFHLHDGARNLGQRDFLGTALLVTAIAFGFRALRTGRLAYLAGVALFCGAAATIKPPALLFLLPPLVLLFWQAWRTPAVSAPRSRIVIQALLWTLLGLVPSGLACVLFLHHFRVTPEFFASLRGVVAYYAGLQRAGLPSLLRRTALGILAVPAAGAAALFLLNRSWKDRDSCLLLLSTFTGVLLVLAQGKGYVYHLYPEAAFLSLWVFWECGHGLRDRRASRVLAGLTLACVILFIAPLFLRRVVQDAYPTQTLTSLKADLEALNTTSTPEGTALDHPALDRNVQCLDMTLAGCINTLYQLKLQPATGFIYDFYLFPKTPTPVTEAVQQRFLAEVSARPPLLFVLSSQIWPEDANGYTELNRWPAFRDFLDAHYRIAKELPQPGESAGYRLYLRR